MIVTQASINALFVAFKVVFQKAQTGTPTDWQKIATVVPSSTRSNTYAWLGQFPAFREWVGDRVLKPEFNT
ncbi:MULTISPECIES: Mu-like prophage major head subunit gpT family protein [Pseudomonas]|uniref:Mu-like prophage major head subunit gpT family protein n=1 Tax=Pseudomonas TaxID=286 RepID=UPI001F0AE220|nr:MULTISPECIES: Mu-like prophage major head subunit gpT family protein [Pseudomonas]